MKRYEEVYFCLEEKIAKGIYPENTLLPSEKELCETFQVSRDTIRKSLGLLNDYGLIQKRQGLGSIVIARKQFNFPISGLTSYKELQKAQNFQSQTNVLFLAQYPVDKEIAKRTGFEEGHYVWHLLRQRVIDGAAVVLDEDFILARYIPAISLEVAEHSIYEYFEHTIGLEIAYAEKEITIESLNEKDKKYLDLSKQDRQVVSVKSHVFLSNATYFQYTESRHQVDKFRFVDFARRNHRFSGGK